MGTGAKALREVYGPEFTKETKSEATRYPATLFIQVQTETYSNTARRLVSTASMGLQILGIETRK